MQHPSETPKRAAAPSKPSLFGPAAAAGAPSKPTDPARVQADAQRLLAAIERPGTPAAKPAASRRGLWLAGASAMAGLGLVWVGYSAVQDRGESPHSLAAAARADNAPAVARVAQSAAPHAAATAPAASAVVVVAPQAVAKLETMAGATPVEASATQAGAAAASAAPDRPGLPPAPKRAEATDPRATTAAAAADAAALTRADRALSKPRIAPTATRKADAGTRALIARAEALEAPARRFTGTPAGAPAAPSPDDPDVELLAALMSHMNERPTPREAVARKDPAAGLPSIAQLVEQCSALPNKADRQACGLRICEGYWGKAEACPTRRAAAVKVDAARSTESR